MNCHEVREQLSVSPRGGTSLTERALAHAHVTQCADCQAQRVSVALALGAPSSVAPSPINLVPTARATRETARTEPTQVLGMPIRFRALTSSSLVVSTRAGARAIEGTWAGLTWVVWRLPILVMLPARAVVGLVEGVRFACIRAASFVPRLGTAAMMACHWAVRAAAEAGGAILGLVSRAIGGTVRAGGRLAVTCWLGVLRTRDVLVRIGGWVLECARFACARSARGLTRLGTAAVMACHGAARAVGDAAGAVLGLVGRSLAEAIRAAGWAVRRLVETIPGLVERVGLAGARSARGLTRIVAAAMVSSHGAARAASEAAGAILGLASRSLGATVHASGRVVATCWLGVLRTCDVVVRLGGQVPALVAPFARAVGRVTGTIPGLLEHAWFAGARAARLVLRLGAPAMMACYGAARAASAAAGAVLGLVARFLGEFARAAGRVTTICWLGALRICDVLLRLGGRVPALVASSARAVGHLVGTVPPGARAHPRVCAGIVSGVVLVSSLLLLGPHPRPDDLFSPGEGLLRDARLPVDRKPAGPTVAPPVVIQVAPPRPAPIPQRIPAPRVAAPEMRAAIPAPVRRSEPAAVDATADASDPGAAIDWLMQGNARRRAESP